MLAQHHRAEHAARARGCFPERLRNFRNPREQKRLRLRAAPRERAFAARKKFRRSRAGKNGADALPPQKIGEAPRRKIFGGNALQHACGANSRALFRRSFQTFPRQRVPDARSRERAVPAGNALDARDAVEIFFRTGKTSLHAQHDFRLARRHFRRVRDRRRAKIPPRGEQKKRRGGKAEFPNLRGGAGAGASFFRRAFDRARRGRREQEKRSRERPARRRNLRRPRGVPAEGERRDLGNEQPQQRKARAAERRAVPAFGRNRASVFVPAVARHRPGSAGKIPRSGVARKRTGTSCGSAARRATT